jgi:hypothetical protein
VSEATHRRIDLAIEQLDTALELFLSGRSFASALTIAGAAEEILGKALSLTDRQHVLDYRYESLNAMHLELHGTPIQKEQFFKDENRARNAAKHMRSLAEDTITVDLQEAAVWMLVRACANYDALEYPRTDRMRQFDDWFYEHVVGI